MAHTTAMCATYEQAMDVESLLAMDPKKLLPQPPRLDAGLEAWDAFMKRQEERVRDLVSKARPSRKGVFTRAAAADQHRWAIRDLECRLNLAEIKNELRFEGLVIDAVPGCCLRSYVCQWKDIPETLYGAKKQKKLFKRDGKLEMVRYLELLEVVFEAKRRQWFDEGRFVVAFAEPRMIKPNLDGCCQEYSEREAARWEHPGNEEETMSLSKKVEPDEEKTLDRSVCKAATTGELDLLSMSSWPPLASTTSYPRPRLSS